MITARALRSSAQNTMAVLIAIYLDRTGICVFARDFEALMSEESQKISSSYFASGDYFLLAGPYELGEEKLMTQERPRTRKCVISVEDLTFSLAGQGPTLRHLNISFPENQITAVIGPSGSGKSTLLRCLNRLWEPPPATVFLDQQDITVLDVLELRQRVGMVMQTAVLFPGTIADNISYGPRLKGKSISRSGLRDLMQCVGLDPQLMDRAADKLSGGQAQRVSIARVLANEPEVLLLDEPTSSLDPAATRTLEETLGQLRDRLGLTIILVSHSMEQVKRIADLSALLVRGAIAEIGTPEHLFSGEHHHLTQSFAQGWMDGRDVLTESQKDDSSH